MKIVFAGSPAFAVPALERLIAGGKVIAVITQPDRAVGRKKVLTPTAVKSCALAHNIPVYCFEKIGNEVAALQQLGADVMITCAYGQILTQKVLDCFPCGVWNIHASILPEFRGASPIQSAILAGKTHTGVTVMRTELALDAGDILLVKRCEIGNLTCGELTEKLSLLGADAAEEAVELLESGNVSLLLQDEAKVSFCKKISKADCKIDFTRSFKHICRLIKAFSPEPAAYCMHGGNILNVLNAETEEGVCGKAGEVVRADKNGIVVACGGGGIKITVLQPAGGKKMSAADFVNGRKIKAGDILE